jgi:UDP-N-acetylglucosamine diphosphorylase/glucosamine-1-phosphate N-acetyltransferase
MNVVVFEDQAVERLGVCIAARPAGDLTIGCHTLVELLGHLGHVRRAPRPHLARYLAALGTAATEARADHIRAIWGGLPDAAVAPAASRHGSLVVLVNARVVPGRDTLVALRGLVEAGRRCVVRSGDATAAALLHLDAAERGPDHEVLDAILADGPAAAAQLDGLGLPTADTSLALLTQPHDLVDMHEREIEGSLALRIDEAGLHERSPGLFVAPSARVADPVVVRRGPVVVEAGAEIGPFVCLDGPVWIGPEARINPHAWIRAGTAIGRGCRVGGEVEASVLEPFANKAHDGFLGHSHVGSWVNLAAGTITGNLKASYGPVRLHVPRADGSRATIHTGRQFLGALVADFVRTAINTSLPCGCRIGPGAIVGGDVPDIVPAFHSMLNGGPGGSRSTAEQAATTLERMMARRGRPLLPADRALLEFLGR